MKKLGWKVSEQQIAAPVVDGMPRQLVFVGDLVDRGPNPVEVLTLVMRLVKEGHAWFVPGNHDDRLKKHLRGAKTNTDHGLAQTILILDEYAKTHPTFKDDVADFLYSAVSHLVFDDGRLVVAHAGLPEAYHNRASSRVRDLCLYGPTSGARKEDGRPVRLDWAKDYRGSACVVYGHTPTAQAQWRNNTLCLDTGCVFGYELSALRWPEKEVVSVPGVKHAELGYELVKEADREGIEMSDVLGTRFIPTPLAGKVKITAEQSHSALETMSRFAVDPRWLIYLPPTISPCPTSKRPGTLEHPDEAFSAYAKAGVGEVVMEEKHMGSRMLALICKDDSVAAKRFDIDGPGQLWTRTGRPFFNNDWQEWVINTLRRELDNAGLWDALDSDWVLLDGELLPWSAKSDELIRGLYAPTATSGRKHLENSQDIIGRTLKRYQAQADTEALAMLEKMSVSTDRRLDALLAYAEAFKPYMWQTPTPDCLRFAPFHILASEGANHLHKPHHWHLSLIDELSGKFIQKTERVFVHLDDDDSKQAGVDAWETLTTSGGEGMVIKPSDGIVRNGRRLVQPAMKVRGREYLRIIYGPEYDLEENITRLRNRSLVRKQKMAVMEFALGSQALDLLVSGAPLHKVHEAVYAVLALESEPVDVRL